MEQEYVRDMSSTIRAQAMREDLLSRDRERELALIIQTSSDSSEVLSAKTELIMSHQKLLIGMARTFEQSGVKFEDLCQAGSLGLLKAAITFDPAQENRFNTFAQWKVLSHMQDLVAESSSSVRIGKGRREKMISRLLRQALASSQVGLTLAHKEAIADRCGVSVKEVDAIAEASISRGISLNQQVGGTQEGDREVELIDVLPDGGAAVDSIHQQSMIESMSRVVKDLLTVLTPRERIVIEGRFLRDDPLTLRELGEQLDVSPERVRQIVRESLLSLQRVMNERGYRSEDVLPDAVIRAGGL